jgi:hypothetical protein
MSAESEERFITVYDNDGDNWYDQYFIHIDDVDNASPGDFINEYIGSDNDTLKRFLAD